ncbi:hypothetical protein JL193_08310 [Polaribacter batillariae]|uniref:NERD domain-containing protein n=1 Tax=Polaribacter batillariae TaxID=2808900 RepID=A0ABX7T2Q2_9FLAO|nr:hypothetical protein [Polaribacter batillariae]QTD39224.1 hypothetical protein JL193_08310 [Polaribacter batillariae]
MINQIKQAYLSYGSNSCNETHITSFYINDNLNGKCSSSLTFKNATCFIENVDKTEIDFVAIDDCLIAETTIQKCDALVTKGNIIWFIELKEIDQSGTRIQFSKRKKNHRKKAVKQLASTINDFKNKGINFTGFLVAGLICFPPFPLLSMPTNIPTTSSQARILEFQHLCGYTELHEGNYISL